MNAGEKCYYSDTYVNGADGYLHDGVYLRKKKITSLWDESRHYVLDENGMETEAATVRAPNKVNFIRLDKNHGRFRQLDGSFGPIKLLIAGGEK